jgi:hypothetical protein
MSALTEATIGHMAALSMLRHFRADGISRKQHLFLCLMEQEVGILRRYQ